MEQDNEESVKSKDSFKQSINLTQIDFKSDFYKTNKINR